MSNWQTDAPRRKWLRYLHRTWTVVSILLALIATGFYLFHYGTRQWGLIASGSNLRQIGMSLKTYANANSGRFPESWEQLLLSKEIELTPEVFITPFAPYDDTHRDWPMTTRARLINTPGAAECRYIFTAAGLIVDALPPDAVIAIEQPEANTGRFANILTADNSVTLLQVAAKASDRTTYDRVVTDFANGVRPVRLPSADGRATTPPAPTSLPTTQP